MAELLESTMLICFGLSWPMNLAKNIKARTARNMSLQFILLIITGYVAGISAKIYTHKFNYVLVVYLLNLLVVSANVIVYFINRRYDRQAAAVGTKKDRQPLRASRVSAPNDGSAESQTSRNAHATVALQPFMHEQGEDEMESYRELNSITEAGGVVLFGSNIFASLPVGELAQAFRITEPIYNRSIRNVRIGQIESYLKVCLYDPNPRKIFVNMGELDILDEDLDIDSFIAKYEWLLYMIHTKTQAAIYIVPIISDSQAAFRINQRLAALASETGCRYVDVSGVLEARKPMLRLFELLKMHMRSHPISFADTFHHFIN